MAAPCERVSSGKIQPYFRVPQPSDPHLYYFVVQGEDCGNGLVRVWLTDVTAGLLRKALGDLTPEAIEKAVERLTFSQSEAASEGHTFGPLAVEVMVSTRTYQRLQHELKGVSDEHNFKQLIDLMQV